MVRMRNLVKVGNREVKKRYIGNKLIFEDLGDRTEVLSGEEVYTDNADDAVVHVEVDGKSYQGGVPTPDHPIEIHSLNDFDVASSVGRKNLITNSDFRDGLSGWRMNRSEYVDLKDGYLRVNSGRPNVGPYQDISDIEVGDTVTISALIRGSGAMWLGMRRSGNNEIEIPSEWERVSSTITRTGNSVTLTFYTANVDSYFDITDIQVEFGAQATPYSPSPIDITESDNHPLIDKINLSLDEPLRSVGDVKDRIFRDTDGLWKVERNVREYTFDGTEIFSLETRLPELDIVQMYSRQNNSTVSRSNNNRGLSSHFTMGTNGDARSHSPDIGERINLHNSHGVMRFRVNTIERFGKSVADTVESDLNNWLLNNPVTVVYELNTPTIETLSQDTQDKLNNLRSFQDSNYVYATEEENLKPTLHTTFKSKGWYDYYLKIKGA